LDEKDWRRNRTCNVEGCTNKVDSTHIRVVKCPTCRHAQRYKTLTAKLNRLKYVDALEFESTILCKVCSKSLLNSKSKHFCSPRCSYQFDMDRFKKQMAIEEVLSETNRTEQALKRAIKDEKEYHEKYRTQRENQRENHE